MNSWRMTVFRGILLLGAILSLTGCRARPPAGAPSPAVVPSPTQTASPTASPSASSAGGYRLRAVLGFGAPRALAWSPDGQRLAIGSAAGVYLLTGEMLSEPLVSTDVRALAWTPDGRALALGTDAGEVILWDATRQAAYNRLRGREVAVTAVDFSPDGMLAVGYADGTFDVWDTRSGAVYGPVVAHTDRLTSLVYCGRLPDTPHPALFTAGRDGTLTLWDGRRGTLRTSLRLPGAAITRLACDSLSGRVYSASTDGVIGVWGPQGQIARYGALPALPLALSVGPAGTLAAGDESGHLWLWSDSPASPARRIQAHTGAVIAVAYQVESDTLASLGADGMLYLWNGNPSVDKDTETPPPQQRITGFGGQVQTALHWDSHLLSAHADGTLRLWDTENAALLRTLTGHRGAINALALSQTTLVSGGMDGTLRLWSPDGNSLGVIYAHRSWVSALTSAGESLVSAAGDGSLALWQGQTLQASANLPSGVWGTEMVFQPPETLFVLRSDGRVSVYGLPGLLAQDVGEDWPADVRSLVRVRDALVLLDGQGRVWRNAGAGWNVVPLPDTIVRLYGGNTWLAQGANGEIWREDGDAISLPHAAQTVTWGDAVKDRLYLGLRSGVLEIWEKVEP